MRVIIYSKNCKEKNKIYYKQLFNSLSHAKVTYAVYHEIASKLPTISGNITSISTYKELQEYNADVMITLGGDGTILSATNFIKDLSIPILGINLGRLGFLANIEQERISLAVEALVAGKYTQQERFMIELNTDNNLFGNENYALNDFTLVKRDNSSMIIIHTYIDGEFLVSYWADGLIVSTPTGSTAYSLSCGGPIMFPSSDNFILTPVAPHNLNVRPVVISSHHKISFEIEGRSDTYLCTLDNRHEIINGEQKLELRKNKMTASFITIEGDSYMRTIRNKLNWGLDKRN
ncbi:NAD kinase [Saprospiraceae bacterium]|nr:NAD kinase [Saprospiraceae bacterium]